jgi:hypothetical protein
MHKEACTSPGSKAAEESEAAVRKPEPWSAQWMGRLSTDEMEATTQEVPMASMLFTRSEFPVHRSQKSLTEAHVKN